MRILAALAVAIAVMPAAVFAQPAPAADEPSWEFTITGSTYVVPDAGDFLQPTLAVDRGWLHLEARYNYEALDTGSTWVGYNFSGGETVTWEFTPMLGAVFGATDGIAPGYKGSLGWKMLELYSEGEYVADAGDADDSFLYNWSELTLAPIESLRFGLVTQRTRVYQTDREIQRGLLAGFSFRALDVTGYVFNPDDEKPTFVLAVAITF
jgi:hypothetical protein